MESCEQGHLIVLRAAKSSGWLNILLPSFQVRSGQVSSSSMDLKKAATAYQTKPRPVSLRAPHPKPLPVSVCPLPPSARTW